MTTSRRELFSGAAAVAATALLSSRLGAKTTGKRPPNIVIIYGDDLGYGDVGCYGASQIKTPNIDKLAAEGVRFTQGHCPSATCTPSRYALLTGEYAWRNPGAHILPGDAPSLIKPNQDTMPAMLKRAGYTTAVIGKWHMGLGNGNIDWNAKITPGPLEIGFDYGFYFPATLDRVPCVFIENHNVVNLDPKDPIKVSYTEKVGNDPTGLENPEMLRMMWNDGHNGTIINGVSRIGFMEGGHSARWKDEDMADTLVGKAKEFMEKNKDKPFFMYFAAPEPHVPRVPAVRFQGSTNMGPRGDAIAQLDWEVGELVNTLKQLGLDDDTLILFSSDNGPVLNDGYDDGSVTRIGNHRPAGILRGGKYGIYDGGLMVPTIARWPNSIPAGVVSDALIDQVDWFSSLAEIVGQTLSKSAAVDSFDLSPALTGRSPKGRTYVIEDTSTINAEQATLADHGDSIIAMVENGWKVIQPHNAVASFHGNDIGSEPKPQLYNLAEDPGETVNMADRFPDRTKAMLARLDAIVKGNRTRPA